jgi:hypothetical protein
MGNDQREQITLRFQSETRLHAGLTGRLVSAFESISSAVCAFVVGHLRAVA